MNPEETAQLQQYLDNLVAVRGVTKLPDADQLIRQAFSRQPDAAYLLVQRCMLLEQGLAQAKARIAQLEDSQTSSGSFLGSGYPPTSPARASAGSPSPYAAAPVSAPGYGSPGIGAAPAAGWGAGGFLGQAAATAAGVAGGAFLFEGLEHLFGHQAGFGSESFIPSSNENVTVNNFFEGQSAAPENSQSADAFSDDETPADEDADFDDDSSSDTGSDWT